VIDPTADLRPQRSMFADTDDLIGLDEYQHWTELTDRNEREGIDGLGFVMLGLFGEVGSLLSELKKKQRDKDSYIAYSDSVIEELGDVLWYFANGALRAGLTFSALAARVTAKLSDWDYHGRTPNLLRIFKARRLALQGRFQATLSRAASCPWRVKSGFY
jgi:NTP pyrophosphatase (non-canonical NTP hydrolase)